MANLPALTARCDSALREPTGYFTTTLWANADPVSATPEVSAWAGRALTSVQSAFHAPSVLIPFRRPRVMLEERDAGHSNQGTGWVQLRVDPAGRVRDRSVVYSTGYASLDSALLRMIDSADAARLVPPPPPGSDTTAVDLLFTTGRIAPTGSVPLGRVQIGEWIVQSLPRLIAPGPMRYPAELRAADIRGRVTTQFVVGAEGRPLRGSVTIRSSPHPDFSEATSELIVGSTFVPGQIRGCAVPVLVQQSVNFTP
jgi:TonB family protein